MDVYNFTPWISAETLSMMEQRDKVKEVAKGMGRMEGAAEYWNEFKRLRNQINNRIKYEESMYKKSKVVECQDCPSKTWKLAKSFMEWKSPGPPTQLEVEEDNKIVMYRKARDLARVMNKFFISKVETIIKGLKKLPMDFSGCEQLMHGKISLFQSGLSQ